jgi:IgGFc binding protein
MKNYKRIALFCFLLSSISFKIVAGEDFVGTRYIVTFPMNDQSQSVRGLYIYISTVEDNTVTVTGKLGFTETRDMKAGATESFKISTAYEISDMSSGDDEQRSLLIESLKPVAVYCYNVRRNTADGYRAIPTAQWGSKYFHCSYYDGKENEDWPSGFVILSNQKNTLVTIRVKGAPNSISSEKTGARVPGDVYDVNLDEGEIYMLRGSGDGTIKTVDFTGTEISTDSNKKIGLISFVARTTMPQPSNFWSSDHLVEMLPPVSSWGREYITVTTDRTKGGGDMFRFLASEPSTSVEILYYDKITGNSLPGREYFMFEAGDFEEYEGEITVKKSFSGTLVIKSDKPILVTQYIYSFRWDDSGNAFDPAMNVLMSPETFSSSVIIQTPHAEGSGAYPDNKVSLIIEGDDTDPANNEFLLNSLTMNGEKVSRSNMRNIPNTKYYWMYLDVPEGEHHINSETKLGGHVYGASSYESYFWPIGSDYKLLGEQDTLAPELSLVNSENGYYKFLATEIRNQEAPAECEKCQPQVDQLINSRPLIDTSLTYNFRLDFPVWQTEDRSNLKKDETNEELWSGEPTIDKLYFDLEVEDLNENAYVFFTITDSYNNSTTFEINYSAEKIDFSSDNNLGKIQVNSDNIFDIVISSASGEVVNYFAPYISQDKTVGYSPEYFELLSPESGTFSNGESATFSVKYSPLREYLDIEEMPVGFSSEDGDPFDVALFVFETTKAKHYWDIYARGGKPYLNISDWAETSVGTGEELYSQNEIKISNYNMSSNRKATYDLVITGIDTENITNSDGEVTGSLGNFSLLGKLALDTENNFIEGPIVIEQTDNLDFVNLVDVVYFKSDTEGEFGINIPFKSNDPNPENAISSWSVIVSDLGIENTLSGINIKNSDGNIFVTSEESQNYSCQIIDMSGVVLYSNNFRKELSISSAEFPSGNYILRIYFENRQFVQKIQITN